MKIRFLDLRTDLGLLSEVLQQVFDGKNAPCVRQVDSRLGDLDTVVISSEPIDPGTAQWIYRDY